MRLPGQRSDADVDASTAESNKVDCLGPGRAGSFGPHMRQGGERVPRAPEPGERVHKPRCDLAPRCKRVERFVGRQGGDFVQYGDADVLGTGTYSGDPTAGATVAGLLPGVVTYATLVTPHGFPFDPGLGDYPGTDQIYAGSQQTAAHDGYSQYAGRLEGPQVVTMDFSAIAPVGQAIGTLTLGIAADDFQNGEFGQPFVAHINGLPFQPLTDAINSLNQTGPQV